MKNQNSRKSLPAPSIGASKQFSPQGNNSDIEINDEELQLILVHRRRQEIRSSLQIPYTQATSAIESVGFEVECLSYLLHAAADAIEGQTVFTCDQMEAHRCALDGIQKAMERLVADTRDRPERWFYDVRQQLESAHSMR